MTTTQTRYSTTETAKLIRKALKQAFPGVKFSVRSSTYSGGSLIDIRWVNGPAVPAVDEIADRFQGADFNGMIDLKEHRAPTLMANPDGTYEEVSYGVDFVHCHRDYSPAVEAATGRRIAILAGKPLPFNMSEQYDVAVDRETGELFACGGQQPSETYGSTILHRHLYVTDLRAS